MGKKVLFIDRDGTLNVEPEDHQVDALEKVALVPGAIPALLTLRDDGYRFVMVTNQDGLGTDSFPEDEFTRCQDHILGLFESQGISFDEIFVCPHFESDACECRKPRTGLLTKYLAGNDLDIARSAVIGDRETDLQLAANIGVRGFLVATDGPYDHSWDGIRAALTSGDRASHVSRKTRETTIDVKINLDEARPVEIDTGIGFFDHMLEQVAKHGGFSLRLSCSGDLDVDEHHTVEDTAICLGQALRQALGDKRGIARYGFLLPMDESEARVSIDLSGRAAFKFKGKFPRENVGEMSTEMVPHFFQSLAEALGAALHIRVKGDNCHHMVEACFKSVGRVLRQAIAIEDTELPSTKGVLG